MKDMYAEIIVDISCENLDHTFQYRIPEDLAKKVSPGSRVLVPFGRGNREIAGFVLDISENPGFDPQKT